MVYYGQDGVQTIAFGELGDQVHGDHLEGECCGVCRDVEQGDLLLVGEDFVLLTWGASFHVVRSPFFQPRPPVVSGDSLDRLVASRVASRWLPVVVVQNFPFKCLVWRDHKSVLCEPKFEAGNRSGLLECEGEFGFPL